MIRIRKTKQNTYIVEKSIFGIFWKSTSFVTTINGKKYPTEFTEMKYAIIEKESLKAIKN